MSFERPAAAGEAGSCCCGEPRAADENGEEKRAIDRDVGDTGANVKDTEAEVDEDPGDDEAAEVEDGLLEW